MEFIISCQLRIIQAQMVRRNDLYKLLSPANEKDLQIALCHFLMKYRSSPHASTGKTPASMMFNREITTRLSLLFPTADVSKVPEEQTARKHEHLE